MFNDEYEVLKQMDDKKFSKIYQCKHIKNNKQYFLKVFKSEKYPDANKKLDFSVDMEIKNIEKCNHKNVIGYKKHGIDGKISGP